MLLQSSANWRCRSTLGRDLITLPRALRYSAYSLVALAPVIADSAVSILWVSVLISAYVVFNFVSI